MNENEKDMILRQRKELKKNARAVMKKHYFLLVFLSLVLVFFGIEYNYAAMGLGKWTGLESDAEPASQPDPGNVLSADDISDPSYVFSWILQGKVDDASDLAERLSEKLHQGEGQSDSAMGMTNGILAKAAENILSGKLFSMLGQAVRSLTHSDTAVAVIFIILSFLWYALIFIFFKNVISAAVRRVYLETRIYDKVSLMELLHFASVRKWLHASWAMLVKYVYLILWSLTIVGGIIKSYSYWAVPYIVAENPAVGASQAVTLSRRMMDGHKLELFKYELTLLGWSLLGIVTFGFSDLCYGTAYRLSCYSEFYVMLREAFLKAHPEEEEVLNDPYLFRKADRVLLYETYFDVVDEITVIHENRIELTGGRKVAADWFGIWLGTIKEKKEYDDQEGRTAAITRCRQSMLGEAYPHWLNPLRKKKKIGKTGNFSPLRNYTVWTLFLLFMAFCFIGWSWEVALHFIQTGQFANRGTMYGPWLPIYGTGGAIALCLCNRFRKNPFLEFIVATALCGVLEYVSAWSLETKYHKRWWSYDGYFLNLHGRICAEGLLVFGIGCCLVVYLIAPAFDYLLSKVRQQILIGICAVLAVLFAGDVVYSRINPNIAEGAVEKEEDSVYGELVYGEPEGRQASGCRPGLL